jgi:hypothetical protein
LLPYKLETGRECQRDRYYTKLLHIANLRIFTAVAKITVEIRWDEKAGLRRDTVRSQVIDALEAQEIKETGNEED